ncbi:cupin [Thermosipho melanesiensis]|uniref:Cupin 2, conserved barrel domain protein n=2 Tax=Thermosipho melanesiensis TaxID=46541 RepID=A6LNH6_THEM4|nr:cupin domain-containing protein [Thermosipho melanesiensis]ABR31477.1 Cupin 2, conserved barrel domain protein [Thermosipho melanesiensis BI429]APT74535.1 cupin [Thermosipho melanesiensis]OOC36486.1 cupin [Thermosipho melanesiensis]OOC37304.1 cupin [Thermosipho melanesiensis]OOC38057.1 cupin [Thermosipho melanesiensis]
MIVSKPERVEPIIIDEGKIEKRILIGSKDGAERFVMRLFKLQPGANTPYHTHDWEHEIFVVRGKIQAVSKDKKIVAEEGSFIFVKPNEEHQFVNIGDVDAEFICVIPYIPNNE